MKTKILTIFLLAPILLFSSLFVGFVYAKTFHKAAPQTSIKPADIIGDGNYPQPPAKPVRGQIIEQNADTAPPSLFITNSPKSPQVSEQVIITAKATDAGGLKLITLWVDGIMQSQCEFAAGEKTGTCDYGNGDYGAGVHSYYATATDISNNSALDPLVGEKEFIVSGGTKPPLVATALSREENQYKAGDVVVIEATAADDLGLSAMRLYLNKQLLPASCSRNGEKVSSCSYTTYPLAAGTYTYYATATDIESAQNTGRDPSTGTKSFTVGMPAGSKPDFVVYNITLSNNYPKINDIITASFKVKNIGTADFDSTKYPYVLGYEVRRIDYYANESIMQGGNVGSIKAGESKTISMQMRIIGLPTKIKVILDKQNLISELNENNNEQGRIVYQ